MNTTRDTSDQAQYLTFFLAGEEYAIGILRVKEIIEYDTITRVPTTPSSIRGVINLRGSVVPVLDLAVKFGLPETAITMRTAIVIVEVDLDGEHALIGLMTDSVSQVIDLSPADIETPPAFGLPVRVDYLVGIAKAEKKFILIFDVDRVLSSEELTVSTPAYT